MMTDTGLKHVSVEDFLPENASPEVRAAFEKQTQLLNSLIDKLNSVEHNVSEGQRAAQEEFYRTVDRFLDEHRQECPDLGNSLTLTEEQALARQEVFAISEIIRQLRGGSLEDCLKDAIKAYNGIHGNPEKAAEDNLRRKLYKHKKKFSPRPGGQKTKPRYESEDEEVLAKMEEKARELGLDLR